MPVLPLVASITVWPGLSSPDFSAASITPSASRSLTEPNGLKASIFTNRFTPEGPSLLIFTTGVLPTVSRMLSYRATLFPPIAPDRVLRQGPLVPRAIFKSLQHLSPGNCNSVRGAESRPTSTLNGCQEATLCNSCDQDQFL